MSINFDNNRYLSAKNTRVLKPSVADKVIEDTLQKGNKQQGSPAGEDGTTQDIILWQDLDHKLLYEQTVVAVKKKEEPVKADGASSTGGTGAGTGATGTGNTGVVAADGASSTGGTGAGTGTVGTGNPGSVVTDGTTLNGDTAGCRSFDDVVDFDDDIAGTGTGATGSTGNTGGVAADGASSAGGTGGVGTGGTQPADTGNTTVSEIYTEEIIADIVESLRYTLPNLEPENVKALVNELANVAESKGVDPAEYISARLVDFLVMRYENPNITVDKMNEQLAVDRVMDLLLDGLNSIYSDIYGEAPDSIDSLLEMQDLGLIFSDAEPNGRSAYIALKDMAYMQYAQDGILTNEILYNSIVEDLISIFPQQVYMTYEQLDELAAKILKLSPEQIMEFTNKILELPSTNDENYQEKYNAFIEEFNNTVSSSNYTISDPNGIVDINTVFQLRMGCDFNPDEIILANEKIAEMQILESEVMLDSVLESILNKYNSGDLSLGDALWQLGYINTNSAIPSVIEDYLKNLTGIDSLYVEGGTVVIYTPTDAVTAAPRRASGDNSNVKTISLEELIAHQRGPLAGVKEKLEELGNSLDDWITAHIPDNFFGDVVSFVYEGVKSDFEAWNYIREHTGENPIQQQIQQQQDIMKCMESHRAEILNGTYTLEDAYAEVSSEGFNNSAYAIFAAVMPGVTEKFAAPLIKKVTGSKTLQTIGDFVSNITSKVTDYVASSNIGMKMINSVSRQFTKDIKELHELLDMDNVPYLTKSRIKDFLELDKEGKLYLQTIGHDNTSFGGGRISAANLRVAPYIKEEIGLLRQGFTSTVREYPTGTSFETALANTPIGEAFQFEGKLYFKAKDGACAELSLTKEMYDKLFPPLSRLIVNQGDSQTCWFLSPCARTYIEPETRYDIVKLFSQVGDDVYVKLPTGQFSYKFTNGEVPNLRELGYEDWKSLSSSSPWTNMLELTASFVRQINGNSLETNILKYRPDLFENGVLKNVNGNYVYDMTQDILSSTSSTLGRLDRQPNEISLNLFGYGEYLLTGINPERMAVRNINETIDYLAQNGKNISMGICFEKGHKAFVTHIDNGTIYFSDPLCSWTENSMQPTLFNWLVSHVSNPRIRNTAACMTAFLAIGGMLEANAQNPVDPDETHSNGNGSPNDVDSDETHSNGNGSPNDVDPDETQSGGNNGQNGGGIQGGGGADGGDQGGGQGGSLGGDQGNQGGNHGGDQGGQGGNQGDQGGDQGGQGGDQGGQGGDQGGDQGGQGGDQGGDQGGQGGDQGGDQGGQGGGVDPDPTHSGGQGNSDNNNGDNDGGHKPGDVVDSGEMDLGTGTTTFSNGENSTTANQDIQKLMQELYNQLRQQYGDEYDIIINVDDSGHLTWEVVYRGNGGQNDDPWGDEEGGAGDDDWGNNGGSDDNWWDDLLNDWMNWNPFDDGIGDNWGWREGGSGDEYVIWGLRHDGNDYA